MVCPPGRGHTILRAGDSLFLIRRMKFLATDKDMAYFHFKTSFSVDCFH